MVVPGATLDEVEVEVDVTTVGVVDAELTAVDGAVVVDCVVGVVLVSLAGVVADVTGVVDSTVVDCVVVDSEVVACDVVASVVVECVGVDSDVVDAGVVVAGVVGTVHGSCSPSKVPAQPRVPSGSSWAVTVTTYALVTSGSSSYPTRKLRPNSVSSSVSPLITTETRLTPDASYARNATVRVSHVLKTRGVCALLAGISIATPPTTAARANTTEMTALRTLGSLRPHLATWAPLVR